MKTGSKGLLRRLVMIAMAAGLVTSGQVLVASGHAGAASGGVINVGTNLTGAINPIEFDPVQFTGPAGFFYYDWPIYAGILRQTTSGAYVPDLASKVTIPDPQTIDITMRPGLVYSNGAPLDAKAVKAGFERNMTNPTAGAWNSVFYNLTSIDVTSSTSLVLHFNQQVASSFYPLLANQESFLAIPTGPSTGAQNTNVAGAGPFMFKSYTPSERLVLVKNPKYWDAKDIKLKGINFINVPAGPQQVNALESGTVDVEVNIQTSNIPALKSVTSLQTNSTFPDANYFFSPICQTGPLANVKVRQALNYATNRVAINNALLFGKGQPAWSIFPSSSVYYDKSLTNYYAYNVKKAKQLLASAGYPKGFSTSLMALPLPANEQVAAVLQNQWKQIGVQVQIVATTNYVNDLYRDHKAQIGLNPQGLPGIQKITTQYTPGTVGDLCDYDNPTLNNITNEIQATPPNSPKLISLWKQAQQLIIKNGLSVYIDFSPLLTAASKSVQNLQVVPYVGGVLNYWVVSVKG